MSAALHSIVCGAGIFGVTSALALRRRGHEVTLIDPCLSVALTPHPLAASTDISKVVRAEYGADREYAAMAERSLDGWRRWNVELGEALFHETGVLFLSQRALTPGGFEADSLRVLQARGHPIEAVDAAAVRARFPAWNAAWYPAGIFNTAGGWVESGRVVARLLLAARDAGVALLEGNFAALREMGSRVRGVALTDGRVVDGDHVVLALGAWTPRALPFAADWFRPHGMPVFHLAPRDPSLFTADRFPVFGADISQTGYYGFPLHPIAGVVKIANHGVGRVFDPSSTDRRVRPEDVAHLRAFLADTFPALVDAPLVGDRVCVYCDTWDGHFWIAPDPLRQGVVLATGGSGHAYKFAPVLGDLIADAVEGTVVPRFAWRPESRPLVSDEAARSR